MRTVTTVLLLVACTGAGRAEEAYSYDETREPFLDPGVKGARNAAAGGAWDALGQGVAEGRISADVDDPARLAGQQLAHVCEELEEHLGVEFHEKLTKAIADQDAAGLDELLVLLGANLVRLKLAGNLAEKLEPYKTAAGRNASCQLIYDELLKPALLAFDRAAGETKTEGANDRALAALKGLGATEALGAAPGVARSFHPPSPERYQEAALQLLAALHEGIPAFDTLSLDYQTEAGEEEPSSGSSEER